MPMLRSSNGPPVVPTSGEALILALKLGKWFLAGIWVLASMGLPAVIGAAVFVTKLDGQVTILVENMATVTDAVGDLKDELIPGDWLTTIHDDLKSEDRRLQVQIDRLEASVAGRSYNGRGYEGDE